MCHTVGTKGNEVNHNANVEMGAEQEERWRKRDSGAGGCKQAAKKTTHFISEQFPHKVLVVIWA